MTDNEIIKAWELEATPMERNCLHARYEEACGLWCEKKHKIAENCMECKEHSMGYYGRYAKATLDLINRLQAENENYSHNVRTMTNSIREYQKALEQAKAEIERLREPTSASAIFELSKQQERAIEEHSKYVAKIKAEAVKEFALELKRIPRISVYKNEIDNLLREKVGESDVQITD